MAEKKFAGVDGPVETAAVTEDYAAAERFDKLRVGKLGVYFREGLKLKYIPYSYIEKAFIRVNEVNATVCCGSTCFTYFRIVFVHGGKEFAEVMSESEKVMDEALALIARRAPDIKTGV